MTFQPGDITDKVWSGDLVTKCEFITDLTEGRMLFFDRDKKCFRLCYWEFRGNSFSLNGWKSYPTSAELINGISQ